MFFLEKLIYFFSIESNFEHFENFELSENSLFLSHSVTTMLLLPIFKLFIFFQKIHQFLGEKGTFWEIVIFHKHFSTILLSLAIFKNSCFFWKKSSNFFLNKSNFERFENFDYFCRILQQICNFYRFLNYLFFFKNLKSVLRKKLNVLRSLTISVAFYDKFATFTDF